MTTSHESRSGDDDFARQWEQWHTDHEQARLDA